MSRNASAVVEVNSKFPPHVVDFQEGITLHLVHEFVCNRENFIANIKLKGKVKKQKKNVFFRTVVGIIINLLGLF